MVSDIFHVVPTDAKINNERGSDPLGEVGSSYSQSKNGYSVCFVAALPFPRVCELLKKKKFLGYVDKSS